MGPVAPATLLLKNSFHSCPFPFLLHLGTYSAPWAHPVISGVPWGLILDRSGQCAPNVPSFR